jgi:hypothetical protein
MLQIYSEYMQELRKQERAKKLSKDYKPDFSKVSDLRNKMILEGQKQKLAKEAQKLGMKVQ